MRKESVYYIPIILQDNLYYHHPTSIHNYAYVVKYFYWNFVLFCEKIWEEFLCFFKVLRKLMYVDNVYVGTH